MSDITDSSDKSNDLLKSLFDLIPHIKTRVPFIEDADGYFFKFETNRDVQIAIKYLSDGYKDTYIYPNDFDLSNGPVFAFIVTENDYIYAIDNFLGFYNECLDFINSQK